MRLINTETGKFETFSDLSTTPPYAILSHMWTSTGEQMYLEVVNIQEKYSPTPPEQDIPHNSHSDNPGAVPDVPTTSPVSPLPVSPGILSPYPIFLEILPLWWSLVISTIQVWISRMLDRATTSPVELEPLNNIQTSHMPPTIRPIWDLDSGLSEKFRRGCEIARLDGYHYIWIDSCCINYTSSSELSEAINSLFAWFRGAQICYAFLADVPSGTDDVLGRHSLFRNSRWFTRSWMLQELIAPPVVVFLSKDWQVLGTKNMLAYAIQEITSIDWEILRHEREISDESIANRMRWAAGCLTTRVEDRAYSLLGIFGITMPPLYGEGEYAFRRFQEEILQRIPDQSLFTWGSNCVPFPPMSPGGLCINVKATDSRTLFAVSPDSFASSHRKLVQGIEHSIESLQLPVEEYTRTPYGIRTQLCMIPLYALAPQLRIKGNRSDIQAVTWYLVVFRSQDTNDSDPRRLLSRLCYLRHQADVDVLYVPDSDDGDVIFSLSLDDQVAGIRMTLDQLQTKTVYLPHPKPPMAQRHLDRSTQYWKGNQTPSLTLPTCARDVLRASGCMVSNVQSSTKHNCHSFSFTLIRDGGWKRNVLNIHIDFRYMATFLDHHCGTGWHPRQHDAVLIEARVWISHIHTPFQQSWPYTSATWVHHEPWPMTLPTQSLNLTTARDEVTLRLGMHTTAQFQYNLDVQVRQYTNTEVGASLHRTHLKNRALPDEHDEHRLDEPHRALNLILLGSARRALKMKGYSTCPAPALDPSLHGSYGSHSLTLLSTNTGSLGDTAEFAIVVKYLYASQDLRLSSKDLEPMMEDFVIVAHVTLESSTSGDGFKEAIVQDGPHVVIWADRRPWKWSLDERHVVLTAPTGDSLTLYLGFDLAWCSEYYLNVDIAEPGIPSRGPQEMLRNSDGSEVPGYLSGWAHKGISLTLPAHFKRVLQAQGFQVHFEGFGGGGESGDPGCHRLTLFHIYAGVTIVITYSHCLITDHPEPDSDPDDMEIKQNYPFLLADPQPGLSAPTAKASLKRCQQELTFQASIQTFPPVSTQGGTSSGVAVQDIDVTATVNWDTKDDKRGAWHRHLTRQDITLTLPTRRQLVLRLGFDLVWYSEYSLTVEIDPQAAPPLSI